MESNGAKYFGESEFRERRYAIRYPFAANVEILDLKTGARLAGVTSDLSLGGCFVCTGRSLEIGSSVHLTLRHKQQNVMMLAVVRVAKPKIGMGFQILEVESSSNETLLTWIETLRRP